MRVELPVCDRARVVGHARRWGGALAVALMTSLGVFAAPALGASLPYVSGVSPSVGPTGGGTSITISGGDLSGATGVTVGGAAATSVAVVSNTEITAVTPAGNAGRVDVQVTTAAGTSLPDLQDTFTYYAPPQVLGMSPAIGAESGGTTVTIVGTGFVPGATTAAFGTKLAITHVLSSTELTAVTPSNILGASRVSVLTSGGASASSPAAQYTYALSAPAGLQANQVGITEVALTWSPPATSSPVVGYTVYRDGGAIPPPSGEANNGAANSPQTTLDGYTTNFVDTNLSAGSSHTYTVKALLANGTVTSASASLPVTTAPGPTKTLTQCLSTALPTGNYVLGPNGITDPNLESCLTFSSTSHVSLDCQGHGITISDASGLSQPASLIDLQGVSHFLLINCPLTASSGKNVRPIELDDDSVGTVADDSVTVSANPSLEGIDAYDGTGSIAIADNAFSNETIDEYGTSNTYVGGNTIAIGSNLAMGGTPYGVATFGGSFNTYDANTISGGAPQTAQSTIGLDDGITVFSSTSQLVTAGDVVSGNTSRNTYDAGFETTGAIANTTIVHNSFSDAYNAGVATYYYNPSWVDVSMLNNNVSQSGTLFTFDQAGGLPTATTYFEYNTLSGNTFTPVSGTNNYAARLFQTFQSTIPTVLAGGNVMTGNNFSTAAQAPGVSPPSQIQVNASNTCATANLDNTQLPCTGTGGPPPTVSSVTPGSGPVGGDSAAVSISGANLTGADYITIQTPFFATTYPACPPGGAGCFTVNSNSSITLHDNPNEPPGTYDLLVTTPNGTNAPAATDQFTYEAAPTVASVGPSSGAGGEEVEITGTNLAGATAVDFGSTPAAIVSDSATSLTVTAPSGSVGTVNVTVSTGVGTSATSSADQFTYVAAPTVTGVSTAGTFYAEGAVAGGTTVTVNGSGFTPDAGVSFGSEAGTNVDVLSSTQLTVTSPAGSDSTDYVGVTVHTAAGTSAVTPPDQFVYGPTVTSMTPTSGPTAGGTIVTVTGTGFNADGGLAAVVTSRGSILVPFAIVSDTQLTLTMPPSYQGQPKTTFLGFTLGLVAGQTNGGLAFYGPQQFTYH